MTNVALISQTLRADHCMAYIERHSADWVILTSNPTAMLRTGRAATEMEILSASPPPHILSASELNRSRRYRRALTWARSGSKVGRWVEGSARWLLRNLRQVNTRGSTTPDQLPEVVDGDVRESEMFRLLVLRHGARPLHEIVVFDVFDLPVALAFAHDFDVEVLVR